MLGNGGTAIIGDVHYLDVVGLGRLQIDVIEASCHHRDGFQFRAGFKMLAVQHHLVHQHRIKAPNPLNHLIRLGARVAGQSAGDVFNGAQIHILAQCCGIQKNGFHTFLLTHRPHRLR